jgi:cardiolipin synthase
MIAFLAKWIFPIALLWVACALAAGTHAILRRRDPRAALWWVGVAFVVPFLGAAAYYFVGINRIQRKASRMGRRPLAIRPRKPPRVLSRADDPSRVSPRMRHLYALSNIVEGVVTKPLMDGNSVQPLLNGDEAYPDMLAAIDGAKESVALATYIFNNDEVGRRFVAALGRAVKRGVQVRVLIDDIGSGFGRSSVKSALEKEGVPAAYFNPTLVPWRAAYVNLRNHRKLMVVDGRVGYSGGMNIHANHVLGAPSRFPTQDIHFKLEGPVVTQLQEAFRDDWTFSSNEKLSSLWFPKLEPAGEVSARGIAGGPDEDYDKLRWTILGALAKAQDSVRIVTPYFLPDSSLITALNIAAMSGIRIDILLPQVNDLIAVQWASTATLWQVLERGCRVWMTPPPFDHSKLMLVDGGWTLFGSSNWDTRSLRLNFEFDVECYDETLTRRLESWVDGKIAAAREVTLEEVDARKLPEKLRDGVARLFTPHL